MTRTIKIIPSRHKTKDGTKEFIAFKAVQKDGKLIDCRFTKACGAVPDDVCEIVVKDENANIDRNRLYPVLWVKKCESIKTRAEKDKESIDVEYDEDYLPF